MFQVSVYVGNNNNISVIFSADWDDKTIYGTHFLLFSNSVIITFNTIL